MALDALRSFINVPGMASSGGLWDGLSPTLIAVISECDHTGAPVVSGPAVRCALVDDANLEVTLNWQSPFDGAGPESRAPTLTAMLQSGALQPIAEKINTDLGGATKALSETARGRTGITKLNSTQVFDGMPPLRLQVTALLRAWQDPGAEVEAPLDQLMAFALPQSLAPEGTLLTAFLDWARSGQRDLTSLVTEAMPSMAPRTLSLQYKGRRFAPLVIETIGVPLHSPSDEQGRFVQMQIPITFATLTAIDGGDWRAYKGFV